MIAPLGTLAFLATLWLLVVAGAAVLEESGAKIVAALKGRLPDQPVASIAILIRMPSRVQPRRVPATWRAAA